MFPHRISETAFTESVVDPVFRIGGDNVVDSVFKTVLRAILPAHMPESDRLMIRFTEKNYTERDIQESGDGSVEHAVFGSCLDEDEQSVRVISLTQCINIPAHLADLISKHEQWERVSRVTDFFKSVFDVAVFVNEAKKATLIIASRLDSSRIHYLTCALFALFPWYFKDKRVSSEEKALLQSLRESTPDKFYETLKTFENQYDFYELKLRGISGFEVAWMKEESRRAEGEVGDINEHIESLSREIADYLRKKEDLLIRLAGLAARTSAENEGEITEYLLANRNLIYLREVDDTSMCFEVLTDLIYWDQDYAETLLKNKDSYLYTERGSAPRLKSSDMAVLFRHLFIECDVVLQMCAKYKLSTRDRRVYALGGTVYSDRCAGRIANPHIHYHSCLGGYERPLKTAMEQHNYVGAIMQCVISAQSVNLLENPTFRPFITELYNTNKKCIRFSDGTLMTPAEAAEALRGKKEESENE